MLYEYSHNSEAHAKFVKLKVLREIACPFKYCYVKGHADDTVLIKIGNVPVYFENT